jgi:two-component sensor histidine kinase
VLGSFAEVSLNGNVPMVISVLTAAAAAYGKFAEDEGMVTKEAVDESEKLGFQLAAVLVEKLQEEIKEPPKEDSQILVPDKTLLGPDGRPLI